MPATGILLSAALSQIVKLTGHLADFSHWPPTMGVATTFATGPAPHLRVPRGVSTESVFIASATLLLSFGLPLAFSAAAATSNSARLAPSCWFHCLPPDEV